jgi:hypothetical protein
VADLADGLIEEPQDAGAYCRAVEAHLCRRNAGHLVRIVGPSFDLVSGWADRGVPLRIACRGIDRYVDRQAAKPARRRPIRIEHCEADVLDVFDEWRRAVGAPLRAVEGNDEAAGHRGASLPSHLARVVARLTALQATAGTTPALLATAAAIGRELDASAFGARTLRGHARVAFLEHLAGLDAQLLAAARDGLPAGELSELIRQAEQELRPFRDRMTVEAHHTAVAALVDRLVRERYQVPFVSPE